VGGGGVPAGGAPVEETQRQSWSTQRGAPARQPSSPLVEGNARSC
jgi:hypothetical protein